MARVEPRPAAIYYYYYSESESECLEPQMSCEPLAPGRHARRTATPMAARARATRARWLVIVQPRRVASLKNTAADGAHTVIQKGEGVRRRARGA